MSGVSVVGDGVAMRCKMVNICDVGMLLTMASWTFR